MKRPISSGQPGRRRGFSLVEVVIALGVITVGFVAVLGVFPAALQTGHSAQDETRAAHIAQSVFGSLVASAPSHFTNAQLPLYPSPSPGPAPLSIDLTSNSPPGPPPVPVLTLYADNEGHLISSSTNAAYAIFIYTNNSVAGFTDPASANAVTVRVAWPANAPAANQTFRDYVRIVSKY
jgi:prepilin-type N-terminal cleavage/methylation domain-containing protein